jgi:hypothetical protein
VLPASGWTGSWPSIENGAAGFTSVHLTNVYANLPTDELVRHEGRFYLVEVRSYLPARDAARITTQRE